MIVTVGATFVTLTVPDAVAVWPIVSATLTLTVVLFGPSARNVLENVHLKLPELFAKVSEPATFVPFAPQLVDGAPFSGFVPGVTE
jgi:hypothetical protein